MNEPLVDRVTKGFMFEDFSVLSLKAGLPCDAPLVSMGNRERRAAKYNRGTEPNRQWVMIQIYLCKYTFLCTVYTCFCLCWSFSWLYYKTSLIEAFFLAHVGVNRALTVKMLLVHFKTSVRSWGGGFHTHTHTPCWQTLNHRVVVSGDVWCFSPLAIYREKN